MLPTPGASPGPSQGWGWDFSGLRDGKMKVGRKPPSEEEGVPWCSQFWERGSKKASGLARFLTGQLSNLGPRG